MIYIFLFFSFVGILYFLELGLFCLIYILARNKGYDGSFYTYRLMIKRNRGLIPLEASIFLVIKKNSKVRHVCELSLPLRGL